MSIRILVGDALARLRELPAESVQCVVTSPPYWGLRDYGNAQFDGGDPDCDHKKKDTQHQKQGATSLRKGRANVEEQRNENFVHACPCGATRTGGGIGLEATLTEHIDALVAVFREVRRVLRRDGTVWLNYGDAYAANRGYQVTDSKHRDVGNSQGSAVPNGMKPKDLLMMPARVALALQADGWWIRSEIVWHKPNPMPESAKDRPTSAHEKVFLLTRAARYFYDADAVRVPAIRAGDMPGGRRAYEGQDAPMRGEVPSHANLRNVWRIATQGFSGWTETSRLVPAEPGAASGDTMHIASSDCPAHAGHPDRVPSAFCGERVVEKTIRTLGKHGRHVREQQGALVPTDPHRERWIVRESSGCFLLECAVAASSRSTESHRKDPALSTSPPCNASVETGRHTGSKSTPQASAGLYGCTAESSSELAGCDAHPSAEKAGDMSHTSSCRCSFYAIVTEKMSHFATFPEALVRPCIAAGTSERGACPECGAPWTRVTEVADPDGLLGAGWHDHTDDARRGQRGRPGRRMPSRETIGWQPGCDHAADPIPCTVMDPFAGAGTVGLVAAKMHRSAVLIELNPEYAAMAERRIRPVSLLSRVSLEQVTG